MSSVHSPFKVLVVDDHAGIRHGIGSLVDAEWPRMHCVGAVATAHEALHCARERQPHVVVLDVDLAGEDGLALIPFLQRAARCGIVVLTSLVDVRVSARALRLGADVCMHKTAPASDLLACIERACTQAPCDDGAVPANAGNGTSRAAWDQATE
jgi:DNA-binding NarL/FixJ family response regulator